MLEVENLHVYYGAIHALHGLTFSVEAGQTVALLGANGAGKTTTLRAISGLVRRSSGQVRFDGRELKGIRPHEIVRLGLGHVPEGRGIFPNFTVEENLAIGAYARADREGFRADREEALGLFPRLKERLTQSAATLSGGEQQMLVIARALVARPRLLLLDEPSLGLAPQLVALIFQIIRQISARGATILLVEQNARMALSVAQYAYVLEVGSIAAHGPSAQLAATDEIRRKYLGIS